MIEYGVVRAARVLRFLGLARGKVLSVSVPLFGIRRHGIAIT